MRKIHSLSLRAEPDEKNLSLRSALGFTLKSANTEARSVDFQLSSEDPVDIYDMERGEVWPEVLLTSGMQLPGNRQVPLQDTHDRSSIKKTLGSVRGISVSSGVPIGKAFFARDDESQDAFDKVVDGHITDGSVGYRVLESVYVEEGASIVHGTKCYKGPVKLATKWLLKEFSLAPIGADEKSKARSETVKADPKAAEPEKTNSSADRAVKNSGGSPSMNKKLYMLLLARGLAVGSTVEQAVAFLETQADKDAIRAESEKPDSPKVDEDAIRAEADKKAVERIAEINDSCRAAGLPETVTAEIAKNSQTIDAARASIIAELKKNNVSVSSNASVQMGETDGEKFRAAASDGIMIRGGTTIKNPAPGAEQFRGKSLVQIAEMCLLRAGFNTRNMSKQEIVYNALRTRGAYAIVGGTADFTSIVLDASNKSLQKGYEEGPRNWSRFASIGSAPDFKNINRIQLFEAPDLVQIDENGNYTEAKFIDGKEVYKLTSNGLRFTISRVAIINDDTSAFSRIPRLLGGAATRKIEKTVYGFLTGGVATYKTADGNFIFSAAHANITTGAALADTALAADIAAMAKQAGRGADGATTPCGVVPRFLHVPWALKYSALALVAATTTYGGVNPLNNELEVLASPFLDLSDAKRRYLTADPNLYDVIEVSFLDGQQNPYLEETDQTDADGRVFKVRLDVGAGVLDWRGLLTNAGQ